MTLRIGDTAPDFEADTTAGACPRSEAGQSAATVGSRPATFWATGGPRRQVVNAETARECAR